MSINSRVSSSDRPTPRARVALVALLLATVLAACSGGSDETSSEPASGSAQDSTGGGSAGGESSDGGASAGLSSGGGGATAGEAQAPAVGSGAAAVDEPRRIRRGSVSVEVDDLSKAAQQVRDLTASLQGYVSDESIGLGDVPDPFYDGISDELSAPPQVSGPGEARLVVRVPETSMQEAMDGIATFGTELSRWSTETEVEAALVDLESRLATQTASVERVRALLGEASSLSDVVQLESELSRREADLESVKAQQEALADRAAMATVTAVLQTPQAVDEEDGDGFLAGLAAGFDALEASTVTLLTIVGALLPFAIVAVLVGLPLVVWRRRSRRTRPVPPPAAASPAS